MNISTRRRLVVGGSDVPVLVHFEPGLVLLPDEAFLVGRGAGLGRSGL